MIAARHNLKRSSLSSITELRDSCIDCVCKHLSQALVLMQEVHQGYPRHHWIAVGHLGEAADEAIKEFPKLAAEIREHRIKYMADPTYDVPVLDLIEKARKHMKHEGASREESLGRTPLRSLAEVSPPGWHGTVRAMKTHGHVGKGKDEIDNPYALAWWMKKRGEEPHYKDQETSLRGTPHKKQKFKDEDEKDAFGPEGQRPHVSTEVLPQQHRFKSLDNPGPRRPHVSTAILPRPTTTETPKPGEPQHKEQATMSIFDDIVMESELTTTGRKRVKAGNFVFPKDRRYPIHDLAHGRNALARVSAHGTPAEKAKVRAAVYAKYPGLKKRQQESKDMAEQHSIFDDVISERELPEAFKKNIGRFSGKSKGESPEHEAAESPEEEREEHESGEEPKDESESIFDSIVRGQVDEAVRWDDLVARTTNLTEDLVNIRDAAKASQ